MAKINFYTKPNCKLCDEAKMLLETFQTEYDFEIDEQNINEDDKLFERYFIEIPVIQMNNEEITAADFDFQTVQAFLQKHLHKGD